MSKIFMYVEFQASQDFTKLNVADVNVKIKEFPGLISKTWLSGLSTNTVGGFYEWDSLENAQDYIENFLAPCMRVFGSLTVKLFNGDVVSDASMDMNSPFYNKDS